MSESGRRKASKKERGREREREGGREREPNSDGLQLNSNGLQPTSDGSNLIAMASAELWHVFGNIEVQ